MYIYRAKRHFSSVEHECKTLDDAINYAASDVEWNAGWPQDIVDKSGAVVLSHDELNARVEAVLGLA